MKNFTKSLLTAALLFAANAQAYYTNFLDQASNALAAAYGQLTSIPEPSREQKAQIRLLTGALRELSKPSTSVYGDFAIFLATANKLGPLAFTPEMAEISTNTFTAFGNEAGAQLQALGMRLAVISDFVPAKRAAARQLTQAGTALNRSVTETNNVQLALLFMRQAYSKIVAATRLTAKAEATPSFAPDSVSDSRLAYDVGDGGGTIEFVSASEFYDYEPVMAKGGAPGGNYTYERTGLHTSVLVLNYTSGEVHTVTVNLTFTSEGDGRFTFRNQSENGVERGRGVFEWSRILR